MDFTRERHRTSARGSSEVRLNAAGNVTGHASRPRPYLPEQPERSHPQPPYDQKPYWDIERARIGDTPRGAGRDRGERKGRRATDHRGRRQGPRAEVRVPVEGEQLDRRARPARGPHQPGVRDRRTASRSELAAQRRVVPEAVNQCWTQKPPGSRRRTGPKRESLRSRARNVPAADRRIRRSSNRVTRVRRLEPAICVVKSDPWCRPEVHDF